MGIVQRLAAGALFATAALSLSGQSALAQPAAAVASSVPAGTYAIDPSHASVAAKVGHLGFSTTTVRFPKISGSLQYDPAHPEKSSVSVEIETASLTSDWEARDKDLRGPGFFNTAAFPTARFAATSLVPVDGNHARIKGQLTLLGVTRPLDVDVTLIGSGKGMMGDGRIGFAGKARFNRSDFGMKTFIPAVSDAVDIEIDAEFSRK